MPLPRTLLSRDQPSDRDLRVTSGSWPEGLGGEMVISAPLPSTFDGPHPFFGEGMVYRLSLQPGTFGAGPEEFAWRHRVVDSPSARLRAKRPDVFIPTMGGVQSPFGMLNAANTAPLPWGDRLFVTWDVGRPVEVDPYTLQFLGEVGHRDQWKPLEVMPQPVLPFIPSTAHPVIDPDRDVMWTVNTHWGQLHVVRWDGSGPIEMWPINDAIVPQSVHTITQTRDWLVVADCAFKVEPQVLSGGERREPANADGPVWLIRKSDIEATKPGTDVRAKAFRVAPENNHYYAVYDDSDGITVLFEHTQNSDLAMTQRAGDLDALGRPCDPALCGLYGFPASPDRTTLIQFDPESGAMTHRAEMFDPGRLWSRQLNAMDWSTEGMSAPTAHHTVHQGWRPEAITQRILALYGDRVDRTLWPTEETPPLVVTVERQSLRVTAEHELAMDDFPSSPIFVPSHPGEAGVSRYAGTAPGGHDGWIVVPVMSDGGFRIEVFEAGDVGRGPTATLSAPGMRVPMLLHAAWMPRAVAADDRPRLRFSEELSRLDQLPADLAVTATEVAGELADGVPLAPALIA